MAAKKRAIESRVGHAQGIDDIGKGIKKGILYFDKSIYDFGKKDPFLPNKGKKPDMYYKTKKVMKKGAK
jgi:hypothetical protein